MNPQQIPTEPNPPSADASSPAPLKAPEPVSPPTAIPQYEPSSEVRFAVVMYGGVSLAIYINGVAQELLRMVRATAPKVATHLGPASALVPPQDLKGSERVYRQLGQMAAGDLKRKNDIKPADPVRRRFIVDILSGTSAGGINGIFLAKALANNQSLDQVEQLWINEGEFSLLINDNDKSSRLKGLTQQKPPLSLLNSRRMYLKLLEAFTGMEPKDGSPAKYDSPLVDELDLFITATDIYGLTLPLQLSDKVVFERRYRNVFHLRYATEYCGSDDRNDLLAQYNPFLAYAARCTSSFPFAFEPMALADVGQAVPYVQDQQKFKTDCEAWRQFFWDYLGSANGGLEQAALAFQSRAFGDGGYLDNKPFTYATDALLHRRADVPVERKLFYVEPSPEHPEDEITPQNKPDVIENVQAALLTLPHAETIREDLERLLERNRIIERVGRILANTESDVRHWAGKRQGTAEGSGWARQGLTSMIKLLGPGYGGYHRLKVATLVDDLALLVTKVSGLPEDSDEFFAIRYLVNAWRQGKYLEDPDPNQPDKPTENQFLLDFDLSYRLRRLNFVQSKVDEIYPFDEGSYKILEESPVKFSAGPGTAPEVQAARNELLQIKRALGNVFVKLLRIRHTLSSSEDSNPLRPLISEIGLDKATLRRILEHSESARSTEAAGLASARASKFDAVATRLSALLHDAFISASDDCARLLGVKEGSPVRQCLWHYYCFYEDYDLIRLPVLAGTTAEETAQVAVTRISPEDAQVLVNERTSGCAKLAGTSFGHFGAFMDRLWRESDIMWGRLDAAERIITVLLPSEHPDREELILDASAAIVEEALSGKGRDEARRLVIEAFLRTESQQPCQEALVEFAAKIRSHTQNPALLDVLENGALLDIYNKIFAQNDRPCRETTLFSIARSTQVIGLMLDGLAVNYSMIGRRVSWMFLFVGRFLWGLVEVSVPRRISQVFYRYWLRLLYLFEVIAIAAGLLFASKPVQQFGLLAVGITFALDFVPRFLTIWMQGQKVPTLIKALAAFFVVGLAVLGILKIGDLIQAAANLLPWGHAVGNGHPISPAAGGP